MKPTHSYQWLSLQFVFLTGLLLGAAPGWADDWLGWLDGGGTNSVAFGRLGTIYSWGNGSGLVFPYYSAMPYAAPTAAEAETPSAATLTGAQAVASGEQHTVALKTDGTVWTWGKNRYGQLGDGTTTDREQPRQVAGLSGMIAVAAGRWHSLAVRGSDGTVWTWGYNANGQLGDGSRLIRSRPVRVFGLTGVGTVAASEAHSLALKKDGTVWAWGAGDHGQLGRGNTLTSAIPVAVLQVGSAPLTGVKAITANGLYSDLGLYLPEKTAHNLALKTDGSVWGWGDNTYYELSNAVPRSAVFFATRLGTLSTQGFTALVSGVYHTVALKWNGTVWSWGANTHGQLGDRSTTLRPAPVPAWGIQDIRKIGAGYQHTLVTRGDGTVWAWGANESGQLGRGPDTSDSPIPAAAQCADGQPLHLNDLYALRVSKTGGLGTVSSSPAGINCGPTCTTTSTANFVSCTKVTLTATPATGYLFSGWTGHCAGTARTCTVILSAAKAVTARFAPLPTDRLTLVKAGSGSGIVTSSPAGISCGPTCAANFPRGATVTLTATPAAGSTLVGWSNCTVNPANARQCTVAMTATKTVAVRFDGPAGKVALTLYPLGTGLGTVASSPAGMNCGPGATCVGYWTPGASVTLTATPLAGATFGGWTGCTVNPANAWQCTVGMSVARVVTARFTAPLGKMTLAVTKTGTGTGTVTSNPAGISCGATCAAHFATGVTVTLTATPANGTTFAGWSGCTPVAANPKQCTVAMTAAKSVMATFTASNLPPMVRITGGCFQMGSPDSEWGRWDDERQHQVCVSNFEIGQTEVTQGQWKAVMGSNPSSFPKGDNYPVETVSWQDIQTYLTKLNQQTGQTYRLPTEAEWEYAARAGTTTPFWTGNCVTTAQANYDGNYGYGDPDCGANTGLYRATTTPVKTFPANAWGLYDTMGNVWEWTCSEYDAQYGGAEQRCNGTPGILAVRGGAWLSTPARVRSAFRNVELPTSRTNILGFRLARSL